MTHPDVLAGMRVFTAVVDCGSFSRAADQLALSRGMASRHVASVEARLGVRLLQRTTRRIALTEAGDEYYRRAMEILALVERAESAAGQSASRPSGTVRLSAPVAFGKYRLAPAIEGYLRRYPEVSVDVALADRMVDLVEEGLDLAIRIAREIDPNLLARPVARARLVACASPAYLKAHGLPKNPEDLRHHNCLTHTTGRQRVNWRFARDGREITVSVEGNCRSNDGELLARAATSNLGIVYEPDFIVAEALASGHLVPILPKWTAESVVVNAVYVNREFMPPKVRTFIDFLAAWFAATDRHPSRT